MLADVVLRGPLRSGDGKEARKGRKKEGRKKEEGRRKEEGGRRKEEGGREEGRKEVVIS